ncbi:hypothetical protein M0804_008783 [Polistes exclamans]|nr:hypothetical protein M0804_008783 [Polistes exclamans]
MYDDSRRRITIQEMNILPLTLRIFHCSNWEHFRTAGAKPQVATINYDGVMPQSIYYAAHRMSPQMIHLRVCTAVLYALASPNHPQAIPLVPPALAPALIFAEEQAG